MDYKKLFVYALVLIFSGLVVWYITNYMERRQLAEMEAAALARRAAEASQYVEPQ